MMILYSTEFMKTLRVSYYCFGDAHMTCSEPHSHEPWCYSVMTVCCCSLVVLMLPASSVPILAAEVTAALPVHALRMRMCVCPFVAASWPISLSLSACVSRSRLRLLWSHFPGAVCTGGHIQKPSYHLLCLLAILRSHSVRFSAH